jgi:hypothetical protein
MPLLGEKRTSSEHVVVCRPVPGIAARAAEIADATAVASIDVTDQSMGHGQSFRDHEYSRRSWVRFLPDQAAERLNTRVIDALKYLNPIAPQPDGPVASAALSASN